MTQKILDTHREEVYKDDILYVTCTWLQGESKHSILYSGLPREKGDYDNACKESCEESCEGRRWREEGREEIRQEEITDHSVSRPASGADLHYSDLTRGVGNHPSFISDSGAGENCEAQALKRLRLMAARSFESDGDAAAARFTDLDAILLFAAFAALCFALLFGLLPGLFFPAIRFSPPMWFDVVMIDAGILNRSAADWYQNFESR
ncbi:MAG TPA: hypothetical protein VFD58_18950 [Blastocatellia bacterium]|nr:hypothetical protein [Blastocatellia bacterium]